MPFEIWREAFLNDADLELAQSSYAQLSPQAYQSLIDKLDLKQFYSLSIPRSYLYCTEDTALAPLKHPVEHLNFRFHISLNHSVYRYLLPGIPKNYDLRTSQQSNPSFVTLGREKTERDSTSNRETERRSAKIIHEVD